MKRFGFTGYRKTILGISLIVIACISLILWETAGRETLLMDEVAVAVSDINEDTHITKEMVASVEVLKGNKIKDVVKTEDIEMIYGKKANQDILKNSQISKEYFKNKKSDFKKYQSIFVIRNEWIDMKSSSLRKGDKVKVFANHLVDGEADKLLGKYKIAYVKDSDDREVLTVNESGRTPITERQDSSAVIDHVEIVCTLQDYMAIREHAKLSELPSLTIVHEMEE